MIDYVKKHPVVSVAALACFMSIVSWSIFYSLGLTTIYNDAMSHLNVARLVLDNMQPGMSQLGSVWLPLSHLLSLPLIWNDFLWHTGLAGSLISMAAYVFGAVGIYKILIHLSQSQLAGIIAALGYMLTLNLLYLQSTPLTEQLYLSLFIYSALYLLQYLKYDNPKFLVGLSLLTAAGVLTRYDGWFVAGIIGLVLLTNELFIRKRPIKAAVGYLILYSFPIAFAMALWLGWNLLIFGDPLYSFTGPYSARAQQQIIESSSGLITKYNAGMSLKAYGFSVIRNVGFIVTLLGSIGWIVYFLKKQSVNKMVSWLFFVTISSIVLFNVVALYLGFSILNLPELHWNPSGTDAGELFNVRYGILALPVIAVGFGLLVLNWPRHRAYTVVGCVVVIILQCVLTYQQGIITIEDGTKGSSAFVNQDIAAAMKANIAPGEKVIMSTSSYNAVAFESGLRLDSFIHEGVSKSWNGAISEPDKYAKWIVIANNDVGEPVHTSLIKNHGGVFIEKYDKVFTGAYASLYRLKQ